MKLPQLTKSWGMAALLAFVLLLLLSWGSTLQAAVPASWKDTGFSINASGMTLRSVLDEFGRTYGVRLAVEIDVDRVMQGRLKADNGSDFLNRLAQPYKFRWFVYNDILHVVPRDDNTSIRLEVGEDAVQDAKAALIGLGLFDDRFGWGELPDEGVVIVGGPRSYVNLARDILLPNEKKTAKKGRQIMVFRLKYATAMDRVINSRGKSETIPGIKTILSNLLFGAQTHEKLSGAPTQFDADSHKRSRTAKNERGAAREVASERFVPLFSAPSASGKNPLVQAGGEDADDGARSSRDKGEGDVRPRIEADPGLNAIMIYDDVKKHDMYAALIAELDVQPQQIEIEALIVDIDRSKLSDMGVEWGVRAGAVNAVINSSTQVSQGIDLPLPGATLLISNAARFYARLKAMESNGEARILATPTVLTLDNVAAVLDLSRSAYVSLIGERVADMSDITAGTMLRVIPRIIHDGGATRVRLEVDIEDGSIDSPGNNGSASNNNNSGTIAASVTRSTISTQAIIDTQQTLMIGGYRQESLTKDRQKVPLLGDLPVVGGLFRSESQSHSTRERLFLITPRISGTVGVDAAPVSKAKARAHATAGEERTPPSTPPASPPSSSSPSPGTAPQPSGAKATAAIAGGSGATAVKLPLEAAVPPASEPEVSKAPAVSLGGGLRLPLRPRTKCEKPRGFSSI
ncbi:type III secretion system outer membrane ring subunit SctC [Collimonas sp.]|jgi:type III secretion protein C|uniref:type III secretion system outer membrane ring subunit SctC n=1 Tax=Collimonas sp. TaxID=1963772 RepID=UPI002C693E87|nr:type III secretion system outer membrane ring subunit SctC [Collimonas sp.]HWW05986.1 type III secretion system outer membrane ring subunit SctC [Collimonas sp.]